MSVFTCCRSGMSTFEISLIAAMGAVTFVLRYSFFALGERMRFPPLLHRGLRYVPVSVLTAIIVPMVLLPDGIHWQLDWRNAWLVGSFTSALLVWRSKPLLVAISGGMAVYFGWRWLMMVL
jgi:branched-subunit amino acid transport protein